MTKEKADRIVEVLNEIASDMEKDAAQFDGKPFNGRTVAEYFGNQGAAIQGIAKALIVLFNELPVAASPDPQEART